MRKVCIMPPAFMFCWRACFITVLVKTMRQLRLLPERQVHCMTSKHPIRSPQIPTGNQEYLGSKFKCLIFRKAWGVASVGGISVFYRKDPPGYIQISCIMRNTSPGCIRCILFQKREWSYRLGTVNSKSFVGKVFLRIKWKIRTILYTVIRIMYKTSNRIRNKFDLKLWIRTYFELLLWIVASFELILWIRLRPTSNKEMKPHYHPFMYYDGFLGLIACRECRKISLLCTVQYIDFMSWVSKDIIAMYSTVHWFHVMSVERCFNTTIWNCRLVREISFREHARYRGMLCYRKDQRQHTIVYT